MSLAERKHPTTDKKIDTQHQQLKQIIHDRVLTPLADNQLHLGESIDSLFGFW